uniref:Uncharacterized protein n=1 Tax=Anguilla anguilla TaxID=7936 RepID=A0A0E9SS54_ANGAN
MCVVVKDVGLVSCCIFLNVRNNW